MLSFVTALFDPLGLFVKFKMRMQILLKTTWAKSEQQWDDKFEKDVEKKFVQWVSELTELRIMPLKRRSLKKLQENGFVHLL